MSSHITCRAIFPHKHLVMCPCVCARGGRARGHVALCVCSRGASTAPTNNSPAISDEFRRLGKTAGRAGIARGLMVGSCCGSTHICSPKTVAAAGQSTCKTPARCPMSRLGRSPDERWHVIDRRLCPADGAADADAQHQHAAWAGRACPCSSPPCGVWAVRGMRNVLGQRSPRRAAGSAAGARRLGWPGRRPAAGSLRNRQVTSTTRVAHACCYWKGYGDTVRATRAEGRTSCGVAELRLWCPGRDLLRPGGPAERAADRPALGHTSHHRVKDPPGYVAGRVHPKPPGRTETENREARGRSRCVGRTVVALVGPDAQAPAVDEVAAAEPAVRRVARRVVDRVEADRALVAIPDPRLDLRRPAGLVEGGAGHRLSSSLMALITSDCMKGPNHLGPAGLVGGRLPGRRPRGGWSGEQPADALGPATPPAEQQAVDLMVEQALLPPN